MKRFATMIPTNLVTHLPLFLSRLFLESKNKNQISGKLVVLYWVISLFFVYSESRSTSNGCRLQQTFIKEFSYMLLLSHEKKLYSLYELYKLVKFYEMLQCIASTKEFTIQQSLLFYLVVSVALKSLIEIETDRDI